MEISLRLDTLGMVEMRYLRGRERFRDWPQFQLVAASRQARVFAHFTREVAEQLHQQVLQIETALGLNDDEDELESEENERFFEQEERDAAATPSTERESSAFSPAFASTLKQLNELARQRLGDANNPATPSTDLARDVPSHDEDDDALEQLQDAFIQMMEVVRELAEEMSTDALKLSSRLKVGRTNIELMPRPDELDEELDDDEDDNDLPVVELVMILQLFEDGHTRPDDLPAVELQLDVDDFERLNDTLEFALDRERRYRRRR